MALMLSVVINRSELKTAMAVATTLRPGETDVLPVDMTREDALGHCLSPGHDVFVAEERDVIQRASRAPLAAAGL